MIAGGYDYRPQLPAIVGTEGVGRVIAAGAGVKHLKEGDHPPETFAAGWKDTATPRPEPGPDGPRKPAAGNLLEILT